MKDGVLFVPYRLTIFPGSDGTMRGRMCDGSWGIMDLDVHSCNSKDGLLLTAEPAVPEPGDFRYGFFAFSPSPDDQGWFDGRFVPYGASGKKYAAVLMPDCRF